MFLHKSSDCPEYYLFDNLSQCSELAHGVFTRDGGASDQNFKSLNLSLSTGDHRDNVYLNRKKVAFCMGVSEHKAVYLNQVHGKEFVILKKQTLKSHVQPESIENALKKDESKDAGLQAELSNKDADGIITDVKGLLTVMQVADCQAVIMYDPENKVVANIHSGWRGSLLNIIGRGVEVMVEQFGTNPAQILAAIAPSLGPCCAEFKNYQNEIPEHLWKYKISEYNFDFWQMSRDQLTEKGVLPKNLEVAGICTSCSSQIFYSYRKENITGRFAVAAGLR
ncbi:MAG: peptidoglycan editing factor PgeF [Desulfamplus sp.]|nr:peptidoglycan editing factor PgeF [Desulfamplus sp.]